jgi:hypothetical protein
MGTLSGDPMGTAPRIRRRDGRAAGESVAGTVLVAGQPGAFQVAGATSAIPGSRADPACGKRPSPQAGVSPDGSLYVSPAAMARAARRRRNASIGFTSQP